MSGVTVVTGGAGYVGAATTEELLASGRRVRVLDVLLHGQEDDRRVAAGARASRSIRGDIRDAERAPRRARGRRRRSCTSPRSSATPPARSTRSSRTRSTSRRTPGARRRTRRRPASSASCSPRPARTTAAWPTRRCRSPRRASCAPVSLYAEQKVGIESALLDGDVERPAPDVPALRDRLRRRAADALRPHRQRVHARPVGRPRARGLRRAVLAPLRPRPRRRAARSAPCSTPRQDKVARRGVQRRPLRRELPQARHRRGDPQQIDRGNVPYVKRDEDPRDYKVSFDKIRDDARLRDDDDRPRRHRRGHRGARRPGRSATRSTRRYRNIP